MQHAILSIVPNDIDKYVTHHTDCSPHTDCPKRVLVVKEATDPCAPTWDD
jgi:hypothetical protein